MPGKTPVLILPDGGVIECLILEGIPLVEFNHPKGFPKRGRAIPTWIEIKPPESGKKGMISAEGWADPARQKVQAHGGSRHGCVRPRRF